ncbi:MAG: hypothetical protein DRN35_05710 [Thermoplasmata archaeon]|nr:MAG: hypothetical protein DRN35_05710 [Thermoplasmata archaeon]RLF71330.1 MAG: hypothetical protein DRN55_07510 [Thermoplasmata archaeon]RLF71764.1 MAG: hypothetical protein DRN40_01845 [Thermoplasmata archaeon]
MRSARRNVDGVSTVVTGIFILTAALMVASGYLIVAGKNYGLREEMVHQASLEETALRISGAVDTLSLYGTEGDVMSFPVRLGTWGRSTTATSRAVGSIELTPEEKVLEIFLNEVNYAVSAGYLNLTANYRYTSPISYSYAAGGVFYLDPYGTGMLKEPSWRIEYGGGETWLILEIVTLTGDFQKVEGFTTASITITLKSAQDVTLGSGDLKLVSGSPLGRLALLELKRSAETQGMAEVDPTPNPNPGEFFFTDSGTGAEMEMPSITGVRISLTVIEIDLRRL